MKITTTPLDGLYVIEPRCYTDDRGFFLETYQETRYRKAGIADKFLQDNQSRSVKGVLRGMHFQVKRPQAQLLTVLRGHIYDVCVDIRPASSTFGQWFGAELSDIGPRQIYMSPGFAHGFYVFSDWADLHYKVTCEYDAGDEGGLFWNDPDVGIKWPMNSPIITPRDASYPRLKDLFL
ncbi:dTDP-4-dehydrorhamnose 3,5-epimerase [Chlorobium ferrooxidans]|uniref:dTDP-4-dehydrorhamnose 3,5-epimerase n=1 Tax=Chlorobium ferrooxidans DSM 13031 TaxID=377431 RepID=Q0YTT8_9CHLB|nr:dTDP-4-dehydrorhamnose 3,5-epimerase [Chlorobium ferrooxidans]EAT59813.1 dTDP-4-dehydrorhamnose 3,5-epimerase [Chlorobium ferrooxidans DSM 13031]